MDRGPGERNFSGPFFRSHLKLPTLSVTLIGVLLSCLAAIRTPAQSWQRLGPPGGDVLSLAEDSAGTVYLGTADGHVFASQDGGDHWQMRGRVGNRLNAVVRRIVPEVPARGAAGSNSTESHSSRLLAGAWYRDGTFGGGIFESTDGARHWKLIGLAGEAVRALEHSSSDSQIWVAGTRSGAFRSRDDGYHWERITPENDPELENVDSLAIDPDDTQTIYVGTYHLPWKTVDGGKHWSEIAEGMIDDSDVMSLRIDAANRRRIFSSACSGIYRSDDAGAHWTKLQGVPYNSRRTQEIFQDARDPRRVYAATTAGLWLSQDAGENWKSISERQLDANAVVVLNNGDNGRVLAGFEGRGVMKSDDGGETLAESNGGYLHRVIEAAAADPVNPGRILARIGGYSDRLLESNDYGGHWEEWEGGTPPRSFDAIIGAASGWFVTMREGGLARYSPAERAWLEIPFRQRVSAGKIDATQRASKPAVQFRKVNVRVASLLDRQGELFAATDDGIWVKRANQTYFQRLAARGAPKKVMGLVADDTEQSHSRLILLNAEALWTSEDDGGTWRQFASPKEGGRLLWFRSLREGSKVYRFVGTERGVYFQEGGSWQVIANGIPAIGSRPVVQAGSSLILAMENGGVYEAPWPGRSWKRIDRDSEQGRAAGLFAGMAGGVILGSESEGFLRYGGTEK
jgi:photosystem II stability/assembly factor-like uncharacterized protein